MKHPKICRMLAAALAFVLMLSLPVSAADYSGAEDAIRRGFEAGAEEIPLEEYDLKIEDLQEIFYGMRNDNQLPWYAESFSYTYDQVSGVIKKLTPNNMDEAIYDRNAYERAVQQVLDEAVFPGMSQWQIALSVHDYLASHFRYDETYTYYTCYDLLVGGTAVCEGYARAYMDILKRAGMEAIYATSDAMDHGWNLVKIDGSWYHVDVTWDDPVSDITGRVRHFYFLVDDTTISDSEHEHYSWETSQTATSDDMNSGVFWQETDSPICYESASVSYLRMDNANEHWIYRRDEQTGDLTELAYFDAGYIDVGYGTYHYQTYGLSLWNGKLYYCDMEHVYAMNTDGSDQTVVYSYDAGANGQFIRGVFVDDGILSITLSDHNNNQTQITETVPGYVPHEHSYTEVRTEPTCTEDGYVTYTCFCGDSYRGETISATGHTYNNGVVTREATDSTDGEMIFTCTTCGDTYTESIPAFVHGEEPTSNTFPHVEPTETTRPREIKTADEDKGGFPIVPVIGGVAILSIVLLVSKSSGKKKKKARLAPKPAPDPYGYSGGSEDDPYGDIYGSSDYNSAYGASPDPVPDAYGSEYEDDYSGDYTDYSSYDDNY